MAYTIDREQLQTINSFEEIFGYPVISIYTDVNLLMVKVSEKKNDELEVYEVVSSDYAEQNGLKMNWLDTNTGYAFVWTRTDYI